VRETNGLSAVFTLLSPDKKACASISQSSNAVLDRQVSLALMRKLNAAQVVWLSV